jgi:hypothetical protein
MTDLGKQSVSDWIDERYENCLRIASLKSGDEKDGWLEDAAYFAEIKRLINNSEKALDAIVDLLRKLRT